MCKGSLIYPVLTVGIISARARGGRLPKAADTIENPVHSNEHASGSCTGEFYGWSVLDGALSKEDHPFGYASDSTAQPVP